MHSVPTTPDPPPVPEASAPARRYLEERETAHLIGRTSHVLAAVLEMLEAGEASALAADEWWLDRIRQLVQEHRSWPWEPPPVPSPGAQLPTSVRWPELPEHGPT